MRVPHASVQETSAVLFTCKLLASTVTTYSRDLHLDDTVELSRPLLFHNQYLLHRYQLGVPKGLNGYLYLLKRKLFYSFQLLIMLGTCSELHVHVGGCKRLIRNVCILTTG